MLNGIINFANIFYFIAFHGRNHKGFGEDFCRSISDWDLAVNLSEILEKYIDQDHGQTILEIGIAVLAPKKMPRIFR